MVGEGDHLVLAALARGWSSSNLVEMIYHCTLDFVDMWCPQLCSWPLHLRWNSRAAERLYRVSCGTLLAALTPLLKALTQLPPKGLDLHPWHMLNTWRHSSVVEMVLSVWEILPHLEKALHPQGSLQILSLLSSLSELPWSESILIPAIFITYLDSLNEVLSFRVIQTWI